MEPCAHHGRTPPCVDAILAAGVARVVAGCLDPNPEAAGGLERLRAAGVDVELDDRFEARRQNEAWRTWKGLGRPFVVYKAAITLDGRVTVPGIALGDGRGLTTARPRAARRARCGRGGDGDGAGGCAATRCPRCPRHAAAAQARLRPGAAAAGLRRSSCARGLSTRSSLRSRPRACSRSCSRAGRRSRRRSSRPVSSTSCSSSSRRPLGRRAALPRRALGAAGAAPRLDAAGRRGPARRGVPPRAVASRPTALASEHVHGHRA